MSETTKKAGCHCGKINVAISRQPEFLQDCNCTLCSKSGGVWGMFDPSEVKIEGETGLYSRNDDPEPAIEVHFCVECGSTTHWVFTDDYIASVGKNDRMAVNMKLFDGDDLEGVELRFPDGRKWTGETALQYRREPVVLGKGYSF